jgi:diaminohydroxyphosphoribosylaminopyrimidine deaminase/5-amino-6-(5-phosphoribosylamino)uracil reductase
VCNGALLAAGCVDELLLYLAPMIVGDAARGMFDLPALTALDEAARFEIRECQQIGKDLCVIAKEVRQTSSLPLAINGLDHV